MRAAHRKGAVAAADRAAVNVVVAEPSPQLIVPEKSLAVAPRLASLKVARQRRRRDPLDATGHASRSPAVSAASATVVVPVSVAVLAPSSLIVTTGV